MTAAGDHPSPASSAGDDPGAGETTSSHAVGPRTETDSAAQAGTWPVVRRWLLRGASVLVLVLVVDYLVLPQLAGAEKSLELLRDADPLLLLLAVALEAGSLVAYSLLTRVLLSDGHKPPFLWVLRADVTGLGVSHSMPGGAATGNTIRFRLLREGGVAADDVAVGLTLEGILSAAALVGLLWAALIVSIPFYGLSPEYLTGAVLGALVLAGVALALVGLGRREALAPVVARRVILRLPRRFQERLLRALEQGADRLQTLLASDRTLRAAAGWAIANWLLDAASLWVFLAAFGHRAHPIGLLVAYSVAMLVGTIPITPSGLGVIEALLIPAVVALGAPHATAVLGVISWRLFEFWAPIPLAGLAYLSLRVQQRLA